MASFGVYMDANGEWHWRLWGDNDKIVADSSEGFKNKSDCIADIRVVKRASSAAVYDMTSRPYQTIPNV
jgi:uncharacterized protein YegP (UPF0339 family)